MHVDLYFQFFSDVLVLLQTVNVPCNRFSGWLVFRSKIQEHCLITLFVYIFMWFIQVKNETCGVNIFFFPIKNIG